MNDVKEWTREQKEAWLVEGYKKSFLPSLDNYELDRLFNTRFRADKRNKPVSGKKILDTMKKIYELLLELV